MSGVQFILRACAPSRKGSNFHTVSHTLQIVLEWAKDRHSESKGLRALSAALTMINLLSLGEKIICERYHLNVLQGTCLPPPHFKQKLQAERWLCYFFLHHPIFPDVQWVVKLIPHPLLFPEFILLIKI